MFFHSRSRSREFLGMIASDSHSRIVGMDFFHSLPVPELWEWIFFIPFPFPNFGNRFFHSLPIPEFWEWFFFIPFPFPNWGNGFFQFPSRSRTSGMELSIPVPVPELPNVIPAHPWLDNKEEEVEMGDRGRDRCLPVRWKGIDLVKQKGRQEWFWYFTSHHCPARQNGISRIDSKLLLYIWM